MNAPVDFLAIVISRDEVQRKDISGPLNALKTLVATPEIIRRFQTRVDVSFSGYDHTREELFEIPEVRNYVYELNQKFPFWLYFLSRESMGLQALSYCFLLPYLTDDARRETHPQQLVDLVEKCWGPALDKICSAAGHTESEADALLESAMIYFTSGPTEIVAERVDKRGGAEQGGNEGQDENDEDGDDEATSDELFGLLIEDAGPFTALADALRLLLQRPHLPPGQIHDLAKLLLIIEALPRPTPGVQVDLDLVERYENGESSSAGIRAGSDELVLECSQYIILDPGIGGDAVLEVWFETSVGGFREEISPFALQEWVDRFAIRAADPNQEILIFTDSSDDSEIDWSPESSESLWEKLDTNFP